MSTHTYTLLLPKPNECGNLLWDFYESDEHEKECQSLYKRIEATGIWCACFPEGDGFCFTPDGTGQIQEPMLTPEYYKRTLALFKEVFGEGLVCKNTQFTTKNLN